MFKNRFFWLAAIVGLILDRFTKLWVVKTMTLGQTIPLLPGVFHITYVINQGAAFSLFQGSVWLRWLSLAVSVGLMALAWFGPRFERWEQLGYGFILSGALGNGIDRFVLGHVVDFIDVRLINFAVFNLADAFINVGIFCLLVAAFRKAPDGSDRTSAK
ncbi:lipoprotein signal peptidase [Phormidesmis priestleyi ULC007]|uniref:Lipoprotein signal peptidase n=1 Tax=Phormidesmis priestleyi ULC007 TaxID=1920490 RepID=A0A2T1DI47_9CYAN|nr:signal peptidase II [Phormidesmis priestleyi]PSB20180.1 lipoprotein signal peptidase [Phormidesmis priestleyi ULC007]